MSDPKRCVPSSAHETIVRKNKGVFVGLERALNEPAEEKIERRIGETRGKKVVMDLGCGVKPEFLPVWYNVDLKDGPPKLNTNNFYFAVDGDIESLQFVEEKYNDYEVQGNLEVVVADIRDLKTEFPEDFADLIIINSVLISPMGVENDSRIKALSEAIRIIKPGGKIRIFNGHSEKFLMDLINEHKLQECCLTVFR